MENWGVKLVWKSQSWRQLEMSVIHLVSIANVTNDENARFSLPTRPIMLPAIAPPAPTNLATSASNFPLNRSVANSLNNLQIKIKNKDYNYWARSWFERLAILWDSRTKTECFEK